MWNPTNGTVTSGSGGANLNEELLVLTPDQNISRLVVAKQNTGAGGSSTDITFLSLNATKVAPIITWTNPAPILLGAALSSIQLDAGANVPGSFAYSPTNGAVLNAGTNTLSVIFTPTDTVDFHQRDRQRESGGIAVQQLAAMPERSLDQRRGTERANRVNTNGVFMTDFKAHNDLAVTLLTSDSVTVSSDAFGGASPGNNPGYLTSFVGVAASGTGDGIAGDFVDLAMTGDVAGTVQFDFSIPLTPQDRILVVDVDGPEQYLLQAYAFNGSSYVQEVNLAGWTAQISGTMGITPNSSWPVWNPTAGTLTSGSGGANLNEELFVLTLDQNINRLVVAKQNTGAVN